MSAIGPKRTSLVAPHMSAFGVKADMPYCSANVRFWPKADMTGLASVYEVFKRQTDLLFATPIP